ncbi:MAG: 2'-5' RNA ligase family protein [Bacteroidetes bacterium]|nr:2'-5' RNA ligase family protein [Bacteroidota bacterium]
MSKNLYLIALIPHRELREEVRKLKLEMSDRFHASHALKAPAHVTLQMPFRRDESEEQFIVDKLREFSLSRTSFKVPVNGFDAFPPRVIFLKLTHHQPIEKLHNALIHFLKNQLEFTEKELNEQFHPHMTIATRDLSKKMFHNAWGELKEREFESAFLADRLHLLRHNGKHWELFEEFPFEGEKIR